MMVLVSYDVSTIDAKGRKRLRRVAKECVNNGVRVQKSIFECSVDPARWEMFKAKLLKIFDSNQDSLRFYFLGSNWKRRVEHHGINAPVELDEPLIV
jgi:CRISPR-associated protein Cas2